jgi:cysteine-rich repeat protein
MATAVFTPQAGADKWVVEYDLDGTYIKISGTFAGIADGDYPIGPGTMIIEFADDSGALVEGTATLVEFDLHEFFTAGGGEIVQTQTELDVELVEDPPGTPGGGTGQLSGDTLAWGAAINGWHTFGRIHCDGSLCPNPPFTSIGEWIPVDTTEDFDLPSLVFSGAGPYPGEDLALSEPAFLSETEPGATYSLAELVIVGTEVSRTLVPDGSAVCGDDSVSGSEQCDDGNTDDGDCCSSTCQYEASGSACSDGDACTTGETCDGAGSCGGGSPVVGLDTDGDTKPDSCDNCPYEPNADQGDTGGVGAATGADGIGDACQCGDINDDGTVDDGDVTDYRDYLASPDALPLSLAGERKCTTIGSQPSDCDVLDVTILRRVIQGPDLLPGIDQICEAAVPTEP